MNRKGKQQGFAHIGLILLFLVVLAAAGSSGYYAYHKSRANSAASKTAKSTGTSSASAAAVTSYDECLKAAGSVQLQTSPPSCKTKDGKQFTGPAQAAAGSHTLNIKEWGVTLQFGTLVTNPTYQFVTNNKYLPSDTVFLSTQVLDNSSTCRGYYTDYASADNPQPTFQLVSRLNLTDKVSLDEGQTTITAEQAAASKGKLLPNNNYIKVGNYVYHYQTGNGEPCQEQSDAMTQAFDDGFAAIATTP